MIRFDNFDILSSLSHVFFFVFLGRVEVVYGLWAGLMTSDLKGMFGTYRYADPSSTIVNLTFASDVVIVDVLFDAYRNRNGKIGRVYV